MQQLFIASPALLLPLKIALQQAIVICKQQDSISSKLFSPRCSLQHG
jgi:hypothetical protein